MDRHSLKVDGVCVCVCAEELKKKWPKRDRINERLIVAHLGILLTNKFLSFNNLY